MKNKTLFFVVFMFFVSSLFGCALMANDNTEETKVINQEINTKITQEVVDVKNISLSGVEDLLNTAYERVNEACVGVEVRALTTYQDIPYEAVAATASGVIYKRIENKNASGELVDYTYYLVTNRHVVKQDTGYENVFYAYFGDDYSYTKLNVLGYDEKVDIACCTFNSTRYINPVVFGDSDLVETSDLSFSVGCPSGFQYYNSITFGAVSSARRYLESDTDGDGTNDFYFEYIQHDTSINNGNSGGGLFNIKGELIGITSMKLINNNVENMCFSIPSNTAKVILEQYLELGKEIIRPRLGITSVEVIKVNPAVSYVNNLKEIPDIYNGEVPYGLYITNLSDVTAFAGTDVEIDDIILQIDGLKIRKLYEFSSLLNGLVSYKVGDKAVVTYYDRSLNEIKTCTITLIS